MRQSTSSEARKKDTREKIELGGLIVKAGLRYEKRATLLGLLIEGAARMRANDGERARLADLGARTFDSERE